MQWNPLGNSTGLWCMFFLFFELGMFCSIKRCWRTIWCKRIYYNLCGILGPDMCMYKREPILKSVCPAATAIGGQSEAVWRRYPDHPLPGSLLLKNTKSGEAHNAMWGLLVALLWSLLTPNRLAQLVLEWFITYLQIFFPHAWRFSNHCPRFTFREIFQEPVPITILATVHHDFRRM